MLPKQPNIVKGKEIGYSSVSKSDTWSQSNRTCCSIIKNKTEFDIPLLVQLGEIS